SHWQVHNPQELAIQSVQSGQARLQPTTDSIWFHTQSGPLVYQNVSGDFKITTQLSMNGTYPPFSQVHWAGLMLRHTHGSGENTIHLVVGQDASGNMSREWSSTVNGGTIFSTPHPPWDGSAIQLRICKVGADMRLYTRAPGLAWTMIHNEPRPDFVGSFQAGMVTHSNATSQLMATAHYEWVRFASVTTGADCTTD
ncbi:MAG TPA: hypothetical protein PKD61_40455, partial [Polyangiaceae bacterium]|nr:hypothetical protein [Polyangiaceae bacterium]